MEVKIKVTHDCFTHIKIGKNNITHGFSKHIKYMRLFNLVKNDIITIFDEMTKEAINKRFVSICIFEEQKKKYFKLNFK